MTNNWLQLLFLNTSNAIVRSTYDSPYDTYESDADLSHLIGNAAQGEFLQLHFFLQAQLELQE